MNPSHKRLVIAGMLYALVSALVAAVLVYEPQTTGKVSFFLLACALATGGTLVLPSNFKTLAAYAAGVFLAAAALISTVLSLDTNEQGGDEPENLRPASFVGKIGHGSAYRAYKWLSKREGQVVRLNLLIDLAPVELMSGGSRLGEALRGNGTSGRQISVVAQRGGLEIVDFRFLPRSRDGADYLSAEFNDVLRVTGAFLIVDTDPSVGSTQIYAAVLDPNVRRGAQ